MMLKRLLLPAVLGLAIASPLAAAALPPPTPPTRYGLIGRMTAQPGKRDALAAVLAKGIANMPGCLSYIVANDPTSPDALWITEVWSTKAAHDASLTLPTVKQAIALGRPLIAAMDEYHETVPIAGVPAGSK